VEKKTGLPDGLFSYQKYNIPKRGKIYLMTKFSNAPKIYPTVVKYCKLPEYISTFSIPRSSKIYSNWDFWSEKKPSGSPGSEGSSRERLHRLKN
jgi:hypothetical protein